MPKTKSQLKNWQEDKIGNLLLKSQRQKKVKRSEYSDKGLYPIIDQGDNLVGGYTNDESYLFDGDLPMTIFGDHTRRFKYIDFPFAIGADGTQLLAPKKGMDRRFFYYVLRNASLKNYGYQRHFKYLKDTKISFPTEQKVQEEIAYVLGSYDDLIENNTKRIKILEEMAQAIYREWFAYFRFPGHEKVKMVDSKTEFGKIPEGWAVKGLDEDFEIVLGGTPSRANSEYWNGDVPWINSSETNHLRVITPSEFITKKGLDNSAAKLMPKRTTVLAITGATLGQVSLLEIECSANQSVVGIYDKNAIYNEYLYLFISDKIDDIISKSGGSAQQHINKKIVEEYQILVPPKKEVDEFNKVIKPIFNLLSDLLFSNQNLRQARDLLLPKLVTGEIRV